MPEIEPVVETESTTTEKVVDVLTKAMSETTDKQSETPAKTESPADNVPHVEPKSAPKPPVNTYPGFNITGVVTALENHFKKPLPTMVLQFASQIMDNTPVKIMSEGTEIATGRLRVSNTLRKNEDGNLFMECYISDLTVGDQLLAVN